MSDSLSATQLAQMINTDPKTLRRFLRENESFRNPGSGGRYSFTQKEAESVQRAFKSWSSTRTKRSKTSSSDSAKGKTQMTSEQRQSAARTRVDALEKSLKSNGKHISQYVSLE